MTDIERWMLNAFAIMGEHVSGPILAKKAWVQCNGCGAIAEIDPEYPEAPEGWRLNAPGDDDFCPNCPYMGD